MPLRPEPKLDYLTKDQVNALLGATKLPHLVVYVALACATGARNSALLELTWDRVDLQRRLIDFTTDSHHKKQYQNWSSDMAFRDYARSIPRAYPEKLSEKSKPKKKFYEYRPIFYSTGVGRWEIIRDTPNSTNLVECISHHTSYTGMPCNLERRYLVELPE